MTGYQMIKSMTEREISKMYGCSWAKARVIKNLDKEGLIKSPDVCPQMLKLPQKYPCNYKVMECRECVRHFLAAEIPGTERVIDGPCMECREKDLCPGYCQERERYDAEIY